MPKRQAQQIVREASEATGMNYVMERWMGGTLTNNATIKKWLTTFCRRFFNQQFKRSCLPDGPKIGLSLSPRGDWRMPSDATSRLWLDECEKL